MSDLKQRVTSAVHDYMATRLGALGKPLDVIASSTDLFGEGVLDSVALTALIAAVEHATGREIDFIDVDPDALGTIDGIVEELTRALESREA